MKKIIAALLGVLLLIACKSQNVNVEPVFIGMGKMRMFSGLVKWHETLPEGSLCIRRWLENERRKTDWELF